MRPQRVDFDSAGLEGNLSWDPWFKRNHSDLARYVNAKFENFVSLDANPYDLERQDDGRREIARAIYDHLCTRSIKYAREHYQPKQLHQVIRTPHEILRSPQEGTCLDLALLYSSICLGSELLPIVVVTERHAYALISLNFSQRQRAAKDRQERRLFSDGPTYEADKVRGLVESGAYIAVECTGVAHTTTLDSRYPEGEGRDTDGLLSFDRAVAAGAEQLASTDHNDALRFAIDVALAHEDLEPYAIGNETGVYTDEGGRRIEAIQQQLTELGQRIAQPVTEPYELPRPVRPAIRKNGVLGYTREREALAGYIQRGDPVTGIVGPVGSGRTSLLRSIAWPDGDPAATTAIRAEKVPDGVVYMRCKGRSADDVVQSVFDEFYASPTPYKPSAATMRRLLEDERALILLDDVDMAPDDVRWIGDQLPNATLVIASTSPAPCGSASVIQLAGLEPHDAVELLKREMKARGRPMRESESAYATSLCKALRHLPGRIVQIAATAAATGDALDGLADRIERLGASKVTASGFDARLVQAVAGADTDRDPQAAFDALPDDQRAMVLLAHNLVKVLAALRVPIGRHLLDRLFGTDTRPALRLLADVGLAVAKPPRYSLAPVVQDDVGTVGETNDWRRRIFEIVADWAEEDPGHDAILAERPQIDELLEWGVTHKLWDLVLRVSRAAEASYVVAGQWGAWKSVLTAAQIAATRLGDRDGQAWVLHELGVREVGHGRLDAGRALLQEADAIWEQVGHSRGPVERNLERLNGKRRGPRPPAPEPPGSVVTTPPPPPRAPPEGPAPTPSPRPDIPVPIRVPPLAATLLAIAMAFLAGLLWPDCGSPPIDAQPGNVDFGDVVVDRAEEQTITLINNTDEAVRVDLGLESASLAAPLGPGGPLAAGPVQAQAGTAGVFTWAHDCGLIEPNGGECELTLRFSPTTVGEVTDTLLFVIGDGSHPIADLRGNGVWLRVDPEDAVAAGIAFQDVAVDDERTADIVVSNVSPTGDPRLVTLALAGGRDALAVSGCEAVALAHRPAAGVNADPDPSRCVATVTFAPPDRGEYSATIVVEPEDQDPVVIEVTGGGAAEPSCQPLVDDELSFGEVPAGTPTTPTGSVQLANTGTGACVIGSIDVTGSTPPAAFRLLPGGSVMNTSCGRGDEIGEPCPLTVEFEPEPDARGKLVIRFSKPAGTPDATVQLNGDVGGSPPLGCRLEAAPPDLTFGDVESEEKKLKIVTVWAGGSDPCTLGDIAVSEGFFRATPDLFPILQPSTMCANGAALRPGSRCVVGVGFPQTELGSHHGALTVAATDANGAPAPPLVVGLRAFLFDREVRCRVLVESADFGSRPLGAPDTKLVAVSNPGPGSCTITAVAVTGDPAFSRGDQPGQCADGTVLAPDDPPCAIAATYAADAVGSFQGQATVSALGTDQIPTRGTGVLLGRTPERPTGCSLSPAPSTIDFEKVAVGSTSPPASFVIANDGDEPCTLAEPDLPSAGFAVGTACAAGTELPPREVCTATVTFAPTQARTYDATAVFNAQEQGVAPAVVTLLGDGRPTTLPDCSLESLQPSVDFGRVRIGTPAPRTVTIKNAGTGTCTGVVTTPPATAPFSMQQSGCSGSLGPNATCRVRLVFTPPGVRTYADSLVVGAATDGARIDVPLTGDGRPTTLPDCSLESFQDSVDFGGVPIGTSAGRTVTVKNAGGGTCTGVATTPPATAPFSMQQSGCSGSLGPNATCPVRLSFAPPGVDTYADSLVVSATTDQARIDVPLTGDGRPVVASVCQLSVFPTSLDFGVVATTAAGPATRSVAVRNEGSRACTIAQRTTTDPVFGAAGCPSPIQPGTTCSVEVSFTPTADKTYGATLAVTAAEDDATASVGLVGQGAAARVSWQPAALELLAGAGPGVVEVTSTGRADLDIGTVSTTAPGFSVNGCSGRKLVPGATCSVTVTFGGTTATNAELHIPTNAVAPPTRVQLVGIPG